MASKIVSTLHLVCERCDHEWIPRRWVSEVWDNKILPKSCPKCKSPYWNQPRRKGKGVDTACRCLHPKGGDCSCECHKKEPYGKPITEMVRPSLKAGG